MARFRTLLLVLAVLSALQFSGCSGKSGITVSLSPSTTPTINQGATQSITATVSNDSTNAGVTWTLSGPGVLNDSSTTSVTYVAPSVLSANTSATVTATSITNTSAAASLTITIDAVFAFISNSLESGTLGVPYSGAISAGGAATPFTWAIISGSLPPGLTLSNSSGTSVSIAGIPTVVGSFNFTVQVSDATGTPLSQSFTIIIAPPPALSVATRSLASGTVGEAYSEALQALNGTPPYSWKVVAGNLPAGFSPLSTSGIISGTPTTAGTTNFTVEVTDSAKPAGTASADLSITVDPNAANDSKLNGNYAFLVNGFDPNGRFMAAGSFVANGAGGISNGVIDTNDPANLQLNQSFSGTYLIGLENLGTMTFTGLGRTFALSMMANGNARIIEFDNTGAQAAGLLLKQDTSAFSTAQITGGFAFGFLGADPQGNRYGVAGEFSADGVGSLSAGQLDDDGSAGATQAAAFTGSYSIPAASTSGRGTMSISVSGQGTTNYSFYVVSASELLAVEIDQVVGQSRRLVAGTILKQSTPGAFQASSLGASVFETSALEVSAGSATPQSQVGFLTATAGSGDITISADQNAGGVLSAVSGNGKYSVASNGRVTLTNSAIATPDPVLYLVSPSQGFIVGSDPGVIFGFMEAQAPPFTAASFSGSYAGGSVAPTTADATSEVDAATADGVSAVAFVTDTNGASGLNPEQSSTGTYALANNGRGEITLNGSVAAILYMISPAEFWALPTSATSPVEMFQQ